ncbi:hypothetical protein [Sphingopyxis terrae]|uniref:Uncharacterized protein n=2 Tax=Sphingopyxis terrae TaxID=33052 RepID=A0A1Y6FSQ4_9SPHN|nr:hypothetical protein [Sphingopyxis terrae]PCF91320.1 hypothetical protein CPA46_07630 [Sphingopyxis terrae subsp. ummariensis]SMQ76491.1 hypothetical protein SAMN06295984_1933 [Sphingopyxis terrae subsp. ummariensis]
MIHSTSNPATEPRDDGQLLPDEPPPAEGGSAGGDIRDIGKRDEERRAIAGAAGVTRTEKQDKLQPDPSTLADNKGAAR